MIKIFDKLTKKRKTEDISLKKSDWPTHVQELNNKSFDKFINTYPITIIDFWAPWCKPCHTMLPRFRRLERIYQGKVAFGRVNTQEETKLAKKYNVQGLPHFGIFHFGEKIGSATGAKSTGQLKDIINTYLSKYS